MESDFQAAASLRIISYHNITTNGAKNENILNICQE